MDDDLVFLEENYEDIETLEDAIHNENYPQEFGIIEATLFDY